MSNPPELSSNPKRMSRYAVASFVIGVLSFFVGYFGAFTGIVSGTLGFLTLRRIEGHPTLAGRKLALTGLVLGGLAALFALSFYDWSALFHPHPERELRFGGPTR